MSLYHLLKDEAGPEHPRIFIAAALAGVANALLLATLNSIAQSPATADTGSLFLYAVCLITIVVNGRYSTHRITELVEALLHRLKARIGDKLLRAELEALERVNAAEICDRVTENTTFISARAGRMATMLQAGFILPFATLYIAWLSPAAFAAVALVCTVGTVKFLDVRRKFIQQTQESARDRVTFLDRMSDLLRGFKETQFGRRRRRDVHDEIVEASDVLRRAGIKANNLFTDGYLVGGSIFLVVLASVVYTLQIYVPLDARSMMNVVSAVMFLSSPFFGFILGVMPYMRSDMAFQEMLALEKKLEHAARETTPNQNPRDVWAEGITTIVLRDVQYEYVAVEPSESFHIGPLNLQIDAGEIVFIVGGNGSGKSTLVKVLTGLYAPTHGVIEVDGVNVDRDNVVAYRDKIAAILSDFHIFSKLHGLAVDEEAVRQWIVRMHLDGQVAFVDGAFTRLNLSTGQKKRLALVVALLEDRPICVFDEWAAEQDPEFRRYFYEELLPALRQRGKTVIVVSHDDRYFHCADRIVTMEYGQIRSIDRRRIVRGAA